MLVSVCIVAYNEERKLPLILSDIKNQTYEHEKMEIVLINSKSTDRTRDIMKTFQKEESGFSKIVIEDNLKKNQAAGWNEAIKVSSGNVIIRIDAHARIPENFVEKNMESIRKGEYVVGGPRPNIVDEPTIWKQVLLKAESSMFGSGISSFRRKTIEKKYVKSVFHGAYRREVFKKVGGFNENLGRTEDNELHYRIRKAGYKICYNLDIISYQFVRGTFRQMIKQKFGNGYWIGLTTGVCPGCLSIYYFVPCGFCVALLLSLILYIMKKPIPLITLNILYWCTNVLMTLGSINNEKKYIEEILLPFIFFFLHLAYGIGTIIGLVQMPFKRKKLTSQN